MYECTYIKQNGGNLTCLLSFSTSSILNLTVTLRVSSQIETTFLRTKKGREKITTERRI